MVSVPFPQRYRPRDLLRYTLLEPSALDVEEVSGAAGVTTQGGRNRNHRVGRGAITPKPNQQLPDSLARESNVDTNYRVSVSRSSTNYKRAHFHHDCPLPFGTPFEGGNAASTNRSSYAASTTQTAAIKPAGKLLLRDVSREKPELFASTERSATGGAGSFSTPPSLQQASYTPCPQAAYEARKHHVEEQRCKTAMDLQKAISASKASAGVAASLSTLQRDSFRPPSVVESEYGCTVRVQKNNKEVSVPAYCWEAPKDGAQRYRMTETSTSRGDYTAPNRRNLGKCGTVESAAHSCASTAGGDVYALLPRSEWTRACSANLQATPGDGLLLSEELQKISTAVADPVAANPVQASSAFTVSLKHPGIPHSTVHAPVARRQGACVENATRASTQLDIRSKNRGKDGNESAAAALGAMERHRPTGCTESRSVYTPFSFSVS